MDNSERKCGDNKHRFLHRVKTVECYSDIDVEVGVGSKFLGFTRITQKSLVSFFCVVFRINSSLARSLT